MPYLILVAVLACGALALGLSPLPRWISLLPGLAVGVFYLVAWLHERQPPASGDSQPGLVAVVGMVFTAVVLVAAVLGRRLRRR
jgi:hypothetical protein